MTTQDQTETGQPTKKRILIIDDEALIREAACAMMNMLGYKAKGVESAQCAEALFRKDATAFDLVLIDLNMPGMLGDECFHLLKEINPSLRAAIITGSVIDDSRIKALKPHGLIGVIQKPFTLDSLEQKLTEFLPAKP
jgi:two-component system cell cycle sensor histidine kinase/response regulator CckA